MTNDELIEIALSVGFEKSDGNGLSGNSDLDELLYVEEYPVGEQLLEFAKIVEANLSKKVYAIIPIEQTEKSEPRRGNEAVAEYLIKARNEYGYSGKPKAWQEGFDRGFKEGAKVSP